MLNWLWGTTAVETPAPSPAPGDIVANHHRSHVANTAYGGSRGGFSPPSGAPSPSSIAHQPHNGHANMNMQMTSTQSCVVVGGSAAPTPLYGQGRPHPFSASISSSVAGGGGANGGGSGNSFAFTPVAAGGGGPIYAQQASHYNQQHQNTAATSPTAGLTPSSSGPYHHQNHQQQQRATSSSLPSPSSAPAVGVHPGQVHPSQQPTRSPSVPQQQQQQQHSYGLPPTSPSSVAAVGAGASAQQATAQSTAGGAAAIGGGRHSDPARLAALVASLINFQPIPKFAEAAMITGKAELLLAATAEGRQLAEARLVDARLEEAIRHRDTRDRCAAAAAERDALADLVARHPLISYTPSITEERTPAIDGLARGVKAWAEARGGLPAIFAGAAGSSSSSVATITALRLELQRAAEALELEVGAVYGPPSASSATGGADADAAAEEASSQPLPLETLSFILLSSLMVDISRMAITVLTTYISAAPPIVPASPLEGAIACSGCGASAFASPAASPAFVPPVSATASPALPAFSSPYPLPHVHPSVGASSSAAATVPPFASPAKANKVFFRSDPRGAAIAAHIRELVLIAKTLCGSGRVCEAAQTVCSIRLAELMSAMDVAVPMEGCVARGGSGARRTRANTLSGSSQRRSVSNASFGSSALPTPSSAGAGAGAIGASYGGALDGFGASTASGVAGHRSLSPVGARSSAASPSNTAAAGDDEDAWFCDISGLRIPPSLVPDACYAHDASLPRSEEEGAGSGAAGVDGAASHLMAGVGAGSGSTGAPFAFGGIGRSPPAWHALVSDNPLLGRLVAADPSAVVSEMSPAPVVHPFVAGYLAQIVGPA